MTTAFTPAEHGGAGGLRRRRKRPALRFNCDGMYRGYVGSSGVMYTAIDDEPYQTA